MVIEAGLVEGGLLEISCSPLEIQSRAFTGKTTDATENSQYTLFLENNINDLTVHAIYFVTQFVT